MPQEITFVREDWRLFLNLATLGQKAGVARHMIGALVIKELVDNALDAGAHVEIKEMGDGWMAVKDDGPGIDPDFASRLGDDWLVKSSSDEVLGLFVWLRGYQDVDPKKLVEEIFEAAVKSNPIDYKTRSQCAMFIAESFKSILAEAWQSIDRTAYWTRAVDKMLDESLGGDFFGTEGQRDPRGDRRG